MGYPCLVGLRYRGDYMWDVPILILSYVLLGGPYHVMGLYPNRLGMLALLKLSPNKWNGTRHIRMQ